MFSSISLIVAFFAVFSTLLEAISCQETEIGRYGQHFEENKNEGASLRSVQIQPNGHQNDANNSVRAEMKGAFQAGLPARQLISDNPLTADTSLHQIFEKIYTKCLKAGVQGRDQLDDTLAKCKTGETLKRSSPSLKEFNDLLDASIWKCSVRAVRKKYEDSTAVEAGSRWLMKHTKHSNIISINESKIAAPVKYDEKTFPEVFALPCFFNDLSQFYSHLDTSHPGIELVTAEYSKSDDPALWEDQNLQLRAVKFGIPSSTFGGVLQPVSTGVKDGLGVGSRVLHLSGRDSPMRRSASYRKVDIVDTYRQDDFFQCLINVIKSLNLPAHFLNSCANAVDLAANPTLSGVCIYLYRRVIIIPIFIQRLYTCFQFFEYDENGRFRLDQKYTATTIEEFLKVYPGASLALETAHAIADNVRVVPVAKGKPGYDVNTDGLARGLGKALFKSTQFGKVVDKLSDAHRTVYHLANGLIPGQKESNRWVQTVGFLYKSRPKQ